MALVTTIGSATADSYGTLAAYQTYGGNMGWTLGATDAADEINLRRAAVTIDASYAFVGVRQYETQALEWPRLWTGLVRGFSIDPDTVPQAVINAQFELAYMIQGGLDPMATVEGIVARAKAGPVEVEYQGGKGSATLTSINRLLRDYVTAGAGQVAVVRG